MSRRQAFALLIVLSASVGFAAYFYLEKYKKNDAPPGRFDPGNPEEFIKNKTLRPIPESRFTDVTAAAGIRFRHENGITDRKLLPETMGGGVAILDYDSDGKPDILFINSCKWPGHGNPKADEPKATPKLYRNLGNWKFEDVTVAAGLDKEMYGMGATVGDVDNDGRPDVFISCVGKHRLFRNVDGKKFEDISESAGVAGTVDLPKSKSKDEFYMHKDPIPFGSSATFLDYDGDGRLDLFVCHYVTWSPAADLSIGSTLEGGKRGFGRPTEFVATQGKLFRNVDGKKFEDVTATAGVEVVSKEGTDANARVRPVGKGLGVIAADVDNDGWPDLIVANDTVRNFFFHNTAGENGKRVFKEQGMESGVAYAEGGTPRGGMGIDWGEFAASRCAAVVANFANEPVTCFEKNATKTLFSDAATSVGLNAPTRNTLKFGAFFFDYDNDSRLDLLLCNGHIEPDISKIQASQKYEQPAQLFWNTGDSECYFEPVFEKNAGQDLFKPMVGRGSAFADFDGDGLTDVILVANGGEARVLRNDGPKEKNHWVRLDLRGDGKASSTSAIGAVVTLEIGEKKIVRTVAGARGYLSQSESVLTIGLGKDAKIDKVTVRWPGRAGATQTWTDVPADKTTILKQGAK
jgi:hypothetical protein